MRPTVLLVLALLLAGATPAQAQLGGGEVTARFEPGTLPIPQGGIGASTLVLENARLQPANVRLYAEPDARVTVLLSAAEALLTPQGRVEVRVEVVPSPRLPPGKLDVVILVEEAATPLAPARTFAAKLAVNITADDLPAGAPLLSPDHFAVDAETNTTRTLDLTIAHTLNASASFRIRPLLPAGWRATMGNATIGPGERAPAPLRLTTDVGAANGTGRIVIMNALDERLAAVLELDLTAREPANQTLLPASTPAANATENGTGAQPTPTSGNATSSPAEDASPTPTNATTDPPRENATDPAPPAAPPPSERAPAAPQEPESPPPARVTLVVDPRSVTLAPGGSARLRLTATSDEDAEVAVRLAAPSALASDLNVQMLKLQAGTPYEMVFVIEASPDLANGTILDASIETLDGRASARFEVVIETPPAPIELTSLRASDAADPHTVLAATGMAAFAAGVGASALALVWTRKRWALAFAGLYARLRPQAVLEHPQRSRMADLIRAKPGLTIREAQKELDLANGAMAHHLRTLEKAGIVRIVHDGMLRRVYPVGHERVAPVPPLGDRVLELLRHRGEATPSDVAAALGVSRQSVHYHLQKMVRDGKLRARVDGRETYLRVAEPALAASA